MSKSAAGGIERGEEIDVTPEEEAALDASLDDIDEEFTVEESAVWQEGRAAKVRGFGPGSLPIEYREDWRALFWALGYSEDDDDGQLSAQARVPAGNSHGGEFAGKQRGKVAEQVPSERTKSEIAKASAKRVDKDIQRYAEEYNEPRFAGVMGGKSFPDSEPVDVVTGKRLVMEDGKITSGAIEHGVELKTVVDNANGKLTMDKYAQVRKVEWERANKGATFHTVVSDDTHMYDPATGQAKPGGTRKYYYRRGVAGSARLGSMHECKDEAELKKLMKMPEADLPQGAKRTDGHLREGRWKFFQDAEGKGYVNSKTGDIARAKK